MRRLDTIGPVKRGESPFLIVAVFQFALSLSFYGKALDIDEPVYVAMARHVLKDPLHPGSLMWFWEGRTDKISRIVQSPPLPSYLYAGAASAAGDDERRLRLVLIPVDIAAALLLFLLAGRFLKRPLLPVLAVLAGPGWWLTVPAWMLEKWMALFGLAALYAAARADARRPDGWWWAAAGLAALAVGSKYSGIVFPIACAAYLLSRGASALRVAVWISAALGPSAAYFASGFLDPERLRSFALHARPTAGTGAALHPARRYPKSRFWGRCLRGRPRRAQAGTFSAVYNAARGPKETFSSKSTGFPKEEWNMGQVKPRDGASRFGKMAAYAQLVVALCAAAAAGEAPRMNWDAVAGSGKPEAPANVREAAAELAVPAIVNVTAAGGRPASQEIPIKIVDKDKFILVAVLRKAKTWDEANQIVADLSPKGEWRLPDDREYLRILLQGINPGIATGQREGGEECVAYVAWIRGHTQEATERFKGTSLAAAFVGGHGVALEPFDLSEVYDYIRKILANEDAPKDEIAHVRRLESQIKDGLVVYAVKDAVKAQ